MGALLIAALVLLVTHLGISGTSLRGQLVGRVGEQAYLGLYSVITFASLGYLIWLYTELPRLDYLWYPDPVLYWVPKVLMVFACVLLVGGFMVKNPTSMGQEGALETQQSVTAAASGVNRITRHPFQWSVILWALSHLVANGDTVSVVFFTTFVLLAGIGSLSLDAKKQAALGEAFTPFTALTSNLPFAAILAGRNKLVLGELLMPLAAGLGLYLAFYFGHEWLSGVGIY